MLKCNIFIALIVYVIFYYRHVGDCHICVVGQMNYLQTNSMNSPLHISIHISKFGCVTGGVWSLRNVSISVPRGVLSGEGQAALLRCSYDLEGAPLYSIRWYRAETEFYRYVPREMPPTLVFPLPGASVDVRNGVKIKLLHINFDFSLAPYFIPFHAKHYQPIVLSKKPPRT